MAMDERGLGKQLQAARQAAGMTQQQLCSQANLSFSTLTKIERGAIKSPSIFTIQSIATTLGLSLDELVGKSTQSSNRNFTQTKSGAKFIYFDVNGCLVHFYQAAFAKIAKDTGARPEVIETAVWRYNNEVCRGTMSISDLNTQLAKQLQVKSIDWQQYYLEAIEPVIGMHKLLIESYKHYKVGLLTNIMSGQLSALKRNGSLPDIAYDVVIDSSEVGVIKPEAHIYEIAEERAGSAPEEILFIDDTRTNIMAAAERGWQILLFEDNGSEAALERVREALEPAN